MNRRNAAPEAGARGQTLPLWVDERVALKLTIEVELVARLPCVWSKESHTIASSFS